jgi:zinc and cadmium transporter
MTIVGCALAFSAGVFVCIALSDLLPEIEFHSHDRVKLSLALLLGVGAAYAIGFLEPEDSHEATAAHAHVYEQAP